ncbi:MAG TPA: CtsR family transcriptional regulator [Bacillota bacterium]|nr:CtsR family transcriptional regulator [Bacillota bacterium]
MGNLADFIEQYLANILAQQSKVELKRQELAKMFRCAPSQINYVLETRFTFERGYLVESKRGEGGYIRIIQIPWQVEGSLPQIVEAVIPETVAKSETGTVLGELVRRGLLELEEAQLCLEVIRRSFETIPTEQSDYVRAKFIKAAVLLILSLKNR